MRQASALAVWLCLASCLQGEVKRVTGKPDRLYEIQLEKRCAYIVQAPLGLDVRSYNLEDGKQVLVFHSGKHAQIALTTFSNGDVIPNVTQYVITIKPKPPGPDPNPPDPVGPTGFAKLVLTQARAVKMSTAWARKIAINFETVASTIAAGGITTREGANKKLYELNGLQPKAHEAFFTYLEKYLTNNKVTTAEQMAYTFNKIGEGLRFVK